MRAEDIQALHMAVAILEHPRLAARLAEIDHFQEVARAHFTVRRLERRYGKDAVRMAYDKLSAPHQQPLEVGLQSRRWRGRDSIIRKN